ncbi:MAG: hypothetical protein ACJ761_03945 [Chloroflexota bacterium]
MTPRSRLSVIAFVLAITVLSAATVAAGGWAEIKPDAAVGGGTAGGGSTGGSTGGPKAGDRVDYGFTVLQHGVTPAGWVKAMVVLGQPSTGRQVSVAATPRGADGHFVAPLTFPDAGTWTVAVRLDQLEVASTPIPVTVRTATGALPAAEAPTTGEAIEAADAERDRLAARVAALESASAGAQPAQPGIPIVATLTLAVLAGAVAGFGVAWLGQRREPDEGRPAGGVAVKS